MANLVNIFNPELVIFGGTLRDVYLAAAAQVRSRLNASRLPAAREHVRLRTPQLGEDAALIGAAELAFERLLADPLGVSGPTGVKSHSWGLRATSSAGGVGQRLRILERQREITATRWSVEENTSLVTCRGSTSSSGTASSHTQASSCGKFSGRPRTSHIRAITSVIRSVQGNGSER